MDASMNSFISDQLHVAQQSRREKLRIQHCSDPSRSEHHVQDYASGLDAVQPVFYLDNLAQPVDDLRNGAGSLYHPASGPSNVTKNSSNLFSISQNNAIKGQTSNPVKSNLVISDVDSSLNTRKDNSMENRGVWKSVSANSNSDSWNTNCVGRYRKSNNQGMVSDISAYEIRAKQKSNEPHLSQFQLGDKNFEAQLHYQNALSDGVTTAVVGVQPSWGSYGGDTEDVTHARYGYQLDISRNAETSLLHSAANQLVVDSYSQGLSLSLCSYPAGSITTGSKFGNPHVPQSLLLHNVASIDLQDSKPCSLNSIRSVGVRQANPLKESVGPSTNHHCQTWPLGPFTGYATIIKSSIFLRPAQQLLHDYCGVIGKPASSSTRAASECYIGEFSDLTTAVNSIVNDTVTTGDIMGASTATLKDSNEIHKGASNSPRGYLRSGYQARNARLLYMLEEVSRRYQQYYQQMQMVLSAFESVTGLAGATPYILYALKSVSQHFNDLRSAISDQLRQIKTFLGEDFSLLHSGIRDKGDMYNKRLKYSDHSLLKHKSGDSSMDLPEPQQHIWRPQRGLPERAVSVLRAWLFEHFLHPYPTDTDKHMLATQTGLTRNQVSNWFINARVRLWKPMVEEVHMLETKDAAERNKNAAEDDNVSTNGDVGQLQTDHPLSKIVGRSMASVNLECPATGPFYNMGDVCVVKLHGQEKQSGVNDTRNMPSIDEGMLDISRYHQTRNEFSGRGSISLTLGLRQSADQLYRLESSEQLPPYIQQQDNLRQHLRGRTTHEYEG